MSDAIDISGYSDEELIRRFSVEINGRRFMRARVLDAIGRRNAERANRKPGDPGTMENPIFKNGKAFNFFAAEDGGRVAHRTSCPSTSDTTKQESCSLGWHSVCFTSSWW